MSQNRYEVLGKIADGGLGSVFKAYDRNLRREVALKRVRADSPEEAERQAEQLFEEARTISTLQHPHIVTVFDVGKDDEGAFIVMELLKGETLEDIIQRGALNEGDFRELATQSLEGMIAAHTTGLIHLDIKPQNFMVIWLPSGKFQIKILDFGLAKLASHPQVQDMADDGSIMGSIFYMAPEQFERSPVDARTDLYSLGCVYYFALTGHEPFQGETGPEVMASHIYHSMVPLSQMRPDLPPQLTAWVEWLMSRDPNQRPTTAAQAHEWFLAGQAPTLASPVTEAEAIALALPEEEEEYIATAVPEIDAPQARPSQPVPHPYRPAPARPTRPVPAVRSGPVGNRPMRKPIVRPVNVASAVAPEHLRHKAAMPKWLTVGVPIGIVAIILAFVAVKMIGETRDKNRLNLLAVQAQNGSPEGTAKDLSMLFRMLEDKATSEVAGNILGKINAGEQTDSQISRAVLAAKEPWARKNLALAIAARGANEAVEPLLTQLGKAKESDVRLATWQALAKIATPLDVPRLLENHSSDELDEVRAGEAAIVNAARQEPDAAKRSTMVLQALRSNSGNDEIQASLVRILGRLGSPGALPDLLKALDSSNVKVRSAAAIAVGDWPTARPIPALEAFIKKEKDSFIRKNAINSLGNLAPFAGESPQDEIAGALINAYRNTRDSIEQRTVLTALTRVSDPAALSFFQELSSKEPRQKPIADPAIKTITASLAKVTALTDSAVLDPAQADRTPGPLAVNDGALMNWFGMEDAVSWLVKLEQPGEYMITVSQAYNGQKPGSYAVSFSNAVLPKGVEKTSSITDFKEVTAGKAQFSKPGHYRLWIKPQQIAPGDQLMRVKQVTITKTAG